MRRFFLILALLAGGYLGADTPFTVSISPGSTINYITGDYGARYTNTSGVTVTITQLGRWVYPGNNQVHTLKIWQGTGHTMIDQVSVNCSGATTNAFVYGALPLGAVSVPPGGTIIITSTEVAGGANDVSLGQNGVTLTDIGTLDYSYWNGTIFVNSSNGNRTYGPVTFQYSAPVVAWTYDGGTNSYPTTGDFYQVKSALAASPAHPGSTVKAPTISTTWFAGGSTLVVPAGITLAGNGAANTIITMGTAFVTSYNTAAISLNTGSTVRDLTISGSITAQAIPFQAYSGASGWRLSHITYNQFSGQNSYFFNGFQSPSGLIDHCRIIAGAPSELIFIKGPSSAWQNPSGIGDGNAVYVENCYFNNGTYVSDINSNGKAVFRMNTIAGGMKIDGHGLASNGDPASGWRGVRRIEAYGNRWTYNAVATWSAFELRGGTNIAFDNYADTSYSGGAGFLIRDYGYLGMYAGFQSRFQTPYNYPLIDQVGAGQDATVAVTTVTAGNYVKIANPGTTTNWVTLGAANANPGTWFFANATGTGDGTVTHNSITEPGYFFNNKKNGSTWARTIGYPTNGASYATNAAGYAIGATSITLATITANTFAENAIVFSGDTTRYKITNNPTGGGPKTITIAAPGLTHTITGAVSASVSPNLLYQLQLGNTSSSFGDVNIIASNRDLYGEAGFDANTGVTVGTVIGSAPSPVGITNQGYWAASEGTWNQSFSGTTLATAIAADYYCEIVSIGSSPTDFTLIGAPNNNVGTVFVATGPGTGNGTVKPRQGRLYVSNGAAWVLTYTPYTYPYTSAGPPPTTPTLLSSSTNTAGDRLILVFSESCTNGAGGYAGVTVTASGGATTWTSPTGSGSTTYSGTLTRPITPGEVVSVSYAQPGNGIESTAAQVDLASFVNQSVTNNSISTVTLNATTLNAAGLTIGP